MKASYERGVHDMETRLTKEVAVVCRDYCTMYWGVAMDQVGVPADLELRRLRIYSSRRIFEKFRSWTLLLSSSLPPKLSFQMLEWVRRLSHRRRPSPLRMPSQSGMWSSRPRMRRISLKLTMYTLRLLILRRTFPKPRPRIPDIGSSFVVGFFFFLYNFL